MSGAHDHDRSMGHVAGPDQQHASSSSSRPDGPYAHTMAPAGSTALPVRPPSGLSSPAMRVGPLSNASPFPPLHEAGHSIAPMPQAGYVYLPPPPGLPPPRHFANLQPAMHNGAHCFVPQQPVPQQGQYMMLVDLQHQLVYGQLHGQPATMNGPPLVVHPSPSPATLLGPPMHASSQQMMGYAADGSMQFPRHAAPRTTVPAQMTYAAAASSTATLGSYPGNHPQQDANRINFPSLPPELTPTPPEHSPTASTHSLGTPLERGASSQKSQATTISRGAISDPAILQVGREGSPKESMEARVEHNAQSPAIVLSGRTAKDRQGSLDRYAGVYVPRWLREVNDDDNFIHFPLAKSSGPDFERLAASFLPRSLLQSDAFEHLQAADSQPGQIIQNEQSPEPSLVRADASWLNAESVDFLDGALEEPAADDKTQSASPHASVGALLQGDPSSMRAVNTFTPDGVLAPSDNKARSHGITLSEDQVAPVAPFSPATYCERFVRLQKAEDAFCLQELASQTLFSTKLSVYRGRHDRGAETEAWSAEGLYNLVLPGIREDYPALVPGDVLELRVLANDSPTWLRFAFDARVFGIRRAEGYVIIKCDDLGPQLSALFPRMEAVRFNVIFRNVNRGFEVAESALRRIDLVMRASQSTSQEVLKQWLFPPQNAPADDSNDDGSFPDLAWQDATLNVEQKYAVAEIAKPLASRDQQRRVPFLIAGPPGTGKTKTIVEMALQVIRRRKDAHILLVAPSPTAADTLALRLARHLGPKELLRVNDESRTFAEVPDQLFLYCVIDETAEIGAQFALPSWQQIAGAKIVVMTTTDVHLLWKSKVSNVELGRWQQEVISQMMEKDWSPRLHWTHLLVDEAGQATEPELCSSLLTVLPSPHHILKHSGVPAIVLCGDISQLGPQVRSHFARNHALDVSLLERLSHRSPYRKTLSKLRQRGRQAVLRGDNGKEGYDFVTFDDAEGGRIAPIAAHLVRNYRARRPALLQAVSMLFYEDALLPSAKYSPTFDPAGLKDLPNTNMPLLFEHIDGSDEWVDEGASFYNTSEIKRVVELCTSLTAQKAVDGTSRNAIAARDIAVITPYREQVWRIRMALRAVRLSEVSVGNVEVYQGLEHLVTVISTVRTSKRFLSNDAKRGMGLVFERKRLCVSISRAKEALLIVGNANLLKVDPYWRSIIAHAKRNDTFRGTTVGNEDFTPQDQQIGALEYAARMQARSDGTTGCSGIGTLRTDDEAAGDSEMLAGRMAATTLFEADEDDHDDDVH